MVQQLLPSTISTHIFEDLRRRIIEGDLAPGQALREEDIRERHGSSRGPIRESLRILLQTGLVEHQPRRGFKVRDYSKEDIVQIYMLRATLEGMVIAELAGRDIAPLLNKLEGSCAVMCGYYEDSDLKSYFEENRRFHQLIIDFAGNRILAETLSFVNEVSLPVRYRVLGDALPSRRSLNYHEKIISHLKTGDSDSARKLTERHILENLDRAVDAYLASSEKAQRKRPAAD